MDLKDLLEKYNIERKVLDNFSDNRLPHAFIVDGFASEESYIRVGIAKIIASFIICDSIIKKPCFDCSSCKKIINDNHPDVIKIGDDGGSKSFHVDRIRDLRQDAFIMPNESEYKIYILDFADNMTIAAQNALLKVLEEPPKNVVFILLCKSALSLLQTIRSRCQIFSFESCISRVYDKKVEGFVKDIVNGIVSSSEWELLVSLSKFIKDKNLFKNVLDALTDVFSESIRGSFEICNDEFIFVNESKRLCSKLTKFSLIKTLEVLEKTKIMLEKNANMNLLISYLCSDLRRCCAL